VSSFFKHPITVAIVGGLFLWCIQLKVQDYKELLNKRIELLEDVVEYGSMANSLLGEMLLQSNLRNSAKKFPQEKAMLEQKITELEISLQQKMNELYVFRNKIFWRLPIYFRSKSVQEKFIQLDHIWGDARNYTLQNIPNNQFLQDGIVKYIDEIPRQVEEVVQEMKKELFAFRSYAYVAKRKE